MAKCMNIGKYTFDPDGICQFLLRSITLICSCFVFYYVVKTVVWVIKWIGKVYNG